MIIHTFWYILIWYLRTSVAQVRTNIQPFSSIDISYIFLNCYYVLSNNNSNSCIVVGQDLRIDFKSSWWAQVFGINSLLLQSVVSLYYVAWRMTQHRAIVQCGVSKKTTVFKALILGLFKIKEKLVSFIVFLSYA